MGAVRSIERYRFDPFELQPDKRPLLKDGATISLRPRAFDPLVALVERAGHLVIKDEHPGPSRVAWIAAFRTAPR